MALIGNAIAMGADSSVNNYTMFCAAFAMLALIFLIPATFNEKFAFMPIAPFILDVLLVLFWFCGAVALAARLGVHSCNNNVCFDTMRRIRILTDLSQDYVNSNSVIRGASNEASACREAQASCAFLWFGWAAFVVSAVFTGTGMRGGAPTGGIRRGPAMSQV